MMDALFFDSENKNSIRENQMQEWRKRRQETFAKRQFFKNLIHTITSNTEISKTRWGNPSYYPKVPYSTHPKRKRRSKPKNNDFTESSIHITTSPISNQDMEKRFDTLMAINPDILSYSAFHWRDIDIITWFTRTTHYSYPIVTSYVGYMVGTLMDIEWEKVELCSIYTYRDAKVIGPLLEFLKSLKVDNKADVKRSIEYLRGIMLK